MQRTFLKFFAVILLLDVAAYGQSLADIARQYKEKQDAQQSSRVKPKVITNQDLGEGPEGRPDLRVERRTTTASAADSFAFNRRPREMNQPPDPMSDRSFAPRQGERREARPGQGAELQRPEMQNNGEQWKERVLEQQSRIASMQARIDQMNASARSGGASAQGPYNRYQARQAERAAEMQQRLDEQKRKLDLMQDAARRQGMHTQVYDP